MATGIPKRASYNAAEVCEIARIQLYVLRSWESEFPRLGVVRAGMRIYRQADLDQVLRIKQLVFDEGLTLAGARRRIEEDGQPQPELPLEEFLTPEIRQRIGRVKQGLQELLGLLGGHQAADGVLSIRAAEADVLAGDGRDGASSPPAHAAPDVVRKRPHKAAGGSREKSTGHHGARRRTGRA
jgi:DNA-binding transcriptional MerR regulator